MSLFCYKRPPWANYSNSGDRGRRRSPATGAGRAGAACVAPIFSLTDLRASDRLVRDALFRADPAFVAQPGTTMLWACDLNFVAQRGFVRSCASGRLTRSCGTSTYPGRGCPPRKNWMPSWPASGRGWNQPPMAETVTAFWRAWNRGSGRGRSLASFPAAGATGAGRSSKHGLPVCARRAKPLIKPGAVL